MIKVGSSRLAAWSVIAGCVGLTLWLNSPDHPVDPVDSSVEVAAGEEPPGADESKETPDPPGSWVAFRTTLTARVVLMLSALEQIAPGTEAAAIDQHINPLIDSKKSIDRICGAILLARLGQYEDARAAANDAVRSAKEDPAPWRERIVELAKATCRIIDRLDATSVGHLEIAPSDRELIESRLGWTGQVLISTASTDPDFEAEVAAIPWKMGSALALFFLIAGLAGLGGSIWLVVLLVRAARGTLALPIKAQSSSGTALVWIFAIWFAATLLVSQLVSQIVDREHRLSEAAGIALQLLVMILPLAAIGLPLLRGTRWSTLRRDLGIHSGAGVMREIGYGFVVYATAVPMVVVGVLIALVASVLAGGGIEDASHPIQEVLAEGGIGQRLMLLAIAAIFAPIIEEIVFRGALYRHLRDVSRVFGIGVSVAVSAVGSSLIFAAIHPQGIFFIPILGALAVAFCLGRETRGSLIAPMVAHGFNNALVLSLGLAMAS
ncbi:MAG: CPBP family intramembrane metalloprotease [Phycisphaerales bacterium]|nr:CPBP family intramembrane metalloprotease [Phycisphaerales bacterium]